MPAIITKSAPTTDLAAPGNETIAQRARRLGVSYHAVKNAMVSRNWHVALLSAAQFRSSSIAELFAAAEGRA